MKKKLILSPNFSSKSRLNKNIKFVIIHYTGMQSAIESINWLKNPLSKVSCHYLIDKKGKIIQMVPENKIAWHAGKSMWKNFIDLNKKSIGIELVNKGHRFGYENFTVIQINSLIKLCKLLKRKYKIKTENFLGHSDIAPLRKIDPGEKFPWRKLSKYKIGLWFKNKKVIKEQKVSYQLFFKNLHKIGYRYFNIYKKSSKDKLIIKAFQRKYLPSDVTGKLNQKTMKIGQYLANLINYT